MDLREVVVALDDLSVDKTEELVFRLGVKSNVLEDIGTQYQLQSGNRKRHSIKAWLDKDTEASWGKLVFGLKKIGMNTMAKTIVEKYEVLVTPNSSVPTSPLEPEVVNDKTANLTLATVRETNSKVAELFDLLKVVLSEKESQDADFDQKESQDSTFDDCDQKESQDSTFDDCDQKESQDDDYDAKESQGPTCNHGLEVGLGMALGLVLGLQHGLLVQSFVSTHPSAKKVEFNSKKIQKLFDTLCCYSDHPNYGEILHLCQNALRMRVIYKYCGSMG